MELIRAVKKDEELISEMDSLISDEKMFIYGGLARADFCCNGKEREF